MAMRTLSTLAALAAAMTAGNPHAAETRYDIDWRGFPIGEITFRLDRGEQNYKIAYEVESTGLLAMVFPFVSKGYSSGLLREGSVVPTTHSMVSQVRGEARTVTIGFDLDGDVANLAVQEEGERDPVPSALQRSPDPLALALTAIKDAAPGVRIEGQSFDGRRAVAVQLICADRLQAELLRCQVDGQLLAGGSKRWQDEHGDDEARVREPVEVLLAKDVVGDGWWPVELAVESRYGPVRARLNAEPAG